jgi:TRAP-type C4-dicarboxylate transport system substrate-binding protein
LSNTADTKPSAIADSQEAGGNCSTGIIDAQINSPAGAVDTQTWDFTKFLYDAQVISPQNMVFVNKAAWAKLDAATQKVVLDAAAAAEKRGWEVREVENKQNLQTLGSKGVKIVQPSPKLAGEFAEIGKKMAAEWAAKAGPEGDAILKAVGN